MYRVLEADSLSKTRVPQLLVAAIGDKSPSDSDTSGPYHIP